MTIPLVRLRMPALNFFYIENESGNTRSAAYIDIPLGPYTGYRLAYETTLSISDAYRQIAAESETRGIREPTVVPLGYSGLTVLNQSPLETTRFEAMCRWAESLDVKARGRFEIELNLCAKFPGRLG